MAPQKRARSEDSDFSESEGLSDASADYLPSSDDNEEPARPKSGSKKPLTDAHNI